MSTKSGYQRSGLSGARTNSGQLLRASAQQNIMSKAGGTGQGFNGTSVTDKKNTAIITYDELQRIRQQCSTGNEYEQEQRNRERLDLQDKSKARVSQWPNTIEAMRKKKDEERIRRLEEEEIERRKIDAMEYELQVQARTQAIERANKAMHDAQDQVKAFHSKMLMCDVVQEREAQQGLKKRKQEFEKQIYQQWEDVEQQKMQDYDEKMRNKLMEEYEKKISNQKIINDQLQDFKMQCIKRIQDEMLEGELVKRQVQEELERERQKDMQRKKKLQDQQASFKQANNDLQVAQQEERKKELEEEKRIEEWAKKRDALEKLRKDKEEQKFQEKQMTRQKLIERQSENLRNMKNREDEILCKQVQEAEDKAAKLFEEQERRKLQMKEAIERSRQQQIDRRNQEKYQENSEQKEFSEFWKIRSEELAIAEQQEREEERLRNEELKSFLRRQMETKQKKVEDQFKQELETATQSQALLDQQEKTFYSYAEQCVKEWQDNGKNVRPLVLELKGYKKKII